MTDVVVETLRIRGPDARRLARVAARELPAALDRALADLDDGVVREAVHVTFAPHEDLDDATLATLWAEAVRTRLLATGAARVRPTPVPDAGPGGLVDTAAGRSAVRAWLERGDPHRPVPVGVLARLARSGTAAREGTARELERIVGERLGLRHRARPGPGDEAAGAAPGRAGRTAAGDGAARLPGSRAGRGAPRAPSGRAGLPGAGRVRAGGTAPSPGGSGRRDTAPPDAPGRSSAGPPTGPTPGPDPLAVLAGLARAAGLRGEVDTGRLTAAAGLVLLHPWLADLGRAATRLLPGEEPIGVRARAFAAVVDPEEPALAADPLVRHLAGDDLTRAGPAAEPGNGAEHGHGAEAPGTATARAELRRRAEGAPGTATARAELRRRAEEALASLAAFLPGFERSSPAFLRESWVRRPGLVEPLGDHVRLTAARLPLDMVLEALPYPVGLIGLPWSAPLSVRFAP